MNLKIIRGNKYSIATIGITIGLLLSIVVTICITLDSNQESIFLATREHYLEAESVTHLDISIPYEQNLASFSLDKIDQIVSNVSSELHYFDLDSYLLNPFINPDVTIWFSDYRSLDINSGPYCDAFYYSPDKADALKSLILPGGRLPRNESEIILIVPEDAQNLVQVNTTYNFSITRYEEVAPIPLNVVGIISRYDDRDFAEYKSFTQYIVGLKNATGLSLDHNNFNIISRKTDYPILLQNLVNQTNRPAKDFVNQEEVKIKYRFDIPNLRYTDLVEFSKKLPSFEKAIRMNYFGTRLKYRPISKSLENFQMKWYGYFGQFLSSSLPLVILAFWLANYVTNHVKHDRLKRYHTLFIRGVSLTHVVGLLGVELFFTFIFSSILGFLGGTILSLILIVFLNMAPTLVIYPENWGGIIMIVGFICVSIIYSKIILSTEKFYSSQTPPPLKERQKLVINPWGFKLLIGGIILYVLTLLQSELVDPQFIPLSLNTYSTIVSLMALFSIILTFIGVLFSLRMIFSYLCLKIGETRSFERNRVLSLAFRNISRYMRTYSDLWFFLTLIISSNILLLTLSTSTSHYYQSQSQFLVGADMRIDYFESEETALRQYLEENLPDSTIYTKITVAFMQYKIEHDGASTSWRRIRLLVIDPETFFDVVYTHPQYQFTSSYPEVAALLQTNSTKVCVSEKFLQEEGLRVGESYPLSVVEFEGPTHPLENVSIVSSYQLFPFINPKDRYQSMIIHQDLFAKAQNLTTTPGTILLTHSYMLNTALSFEIINSMEEIFNITVTSSEEEYRQLQLTHSWDQLISMQHSYFILSSILSIWGLLIFSLIQARQRRREHSIEQALGLRRQDLRNIIAVEKFFLLTLSVIGGYIVGILFASVYVFNSVILGTNASIIDSFEGLSQYVILPVSFLLPYGTFYVIIMLISIIPIISVHYRYDVGVLLKQIE